MFYTYLWLREDSTPYYVGKGKGNRAWRKGSPPVERVVVYPAESEAEAFENEIALIWYYGRKDLGTGCLRNLTDGGEGQSGAQFSEDWRSKIISKLTGHPVSEETRAKIGKANKGRPVSDELAKDRSERQKKRCSNPQELQRMKERALCTWEDPGYHKQRSESQRSLWADPEYRSKMTAKRIEQGKKKSLLWLQSQSKEKQHGKQQR